MSRVIPEPAIRSIVQQLARNHLHGKTSTVDNWLGFADLVREHMGLAAAAFGSDSAPTVLLLILRGRVRLTVRSPKDSRKPRGPAVVLPFGRTKPGFGRASRTVAR